MKYSFLLNFNKKATLSNQSFKSWAWHLLMFFIWFFLVKVITEKSFKSPKVPLDKCFHYLKIYNFLFCTKSRVSAITSSEGGLESAKFCIFGLSSLLSSVVNYFKVQNLPLDKYFCYCNVHLSLRFQKKFGFEGSQFQRIGVTPVEFY